MNKPEHWENDFPIAQAQEHKISRREFTKFVCMGAAACACAAAAGKKWMPEMEVGEPVAVAGIGELSVGDSKLFRYPTKDHPAILIHLEAGYVAYSQNCTHLMCPIHFNAAKKQLICPCHEGYFNPSDGSVISGPPPRALPSFPVTVKSGTIYVG